MNAYYNEIEPSAVLWLQAAMDEGIIAAGDIDTRPIQEVKADDIRGYTQCHLFAGIGGWSIALRLAGWPDDRPVWTGSCPCQPFSITGKKKGKADDRHLWPVWYGLIRECRPPVVFGEQVSSAIAHGWLDDVYQGLESEGYAIGSAVLPACSVGKAHKRDRLWFVAESELCRLERQQNERPAGVLSAVDVEAEPREPVGTHGASIMDDSCESEGAGASEYVADRTGEGLEERRLETGVERGQEQRPERLCEDEFHWLSCPDGKARPIKPGIHLLVDGLPRRLRKAALHGYGNAIVPQVAAEFIKAYMETQ